VAGADLALVQRIEAHAALAWPAAETLMLDGWQLNLTRGSTSKRINALTPVVPREQSFDRAFAAARAAWAKQGRPAVVRMTPLAGPEAATRLDALGARREGETVVEILTVAPRPAEPEVAFLDGPPADWIAVTARTEPDRAAIEERLAEVRLPQAFAALCAQDGRVLSVGRAVAGDGLLGLFHIATRPECRRQGFGRRIVNALLGWGHRHGAALAYLQVEAANAPARAVYERSGFREAYRYHYRVLGG
jgi:ribosomal protein S18 acetylase RimI-like enzyme